MKIPCGLETVEAAGSGPNMMNRFSRLFWEEIYRCIAAAGFTAIELPHKPYAFNLGRSGAPLTTVALKTKYGSVKGFLKFLNEIGIDEISNLYINAHDVLFDLLDTGRDPAGLYDALVEFAKESIDAACELGAKGLVVTPTPEIAALADIFGGGKDGWQPEVVSHTIEALNKIGEVAKENGIEVAVRSDFWCMAHGAHIDDFMVKLDKSILFCSDLSHIAIGGQDPLAMLAKYKGRIEFAHFNDTTFHDTEGNFKKSGAEIPQSGQQRIYCDIGEGEIDLIGAYKVLVESGYKGWIITESKKSLNVYRGLLKMRWFIDHKLVKN